MDVICSLELPDSAVPIVENGKIVGFVFAPDEEAPDTPIDLAALDGWTQLGFISDD